MADVISGSKYDFEREEMIEVIVRTNDEIHMDSNFDETELYKMSDDELRDLFETCREENLVEVLVEDYGFERADIEGLSYDDLYAEYEEVTDLSSMLPNETLEEYLEHEDL